MRVRSKSDVQSAPDEVGGEERAGDDGSVDIVDLDLHRRCVRVAVQSIWKHSGHDMVLSDQKRSIASESQSARRVVTGRTDEVECVLSVCDRVESHLVRWLLC